MVAPIVENLFTVVLEQVGPNSALKVNSVRLSDGQTRVAADLEVTLQMCSQLSSVTNVLRGAMPKANCWLGASILANWVLETCMSTVFNPACCPIWEPHV